MRDTDIRQEIEKLKKDRNAVVLAHLYTHPEVQDLADIVGDSLDLSRKAMEAEADVIVFCGVRFMAETAKILNPDRTVLLPDPDAGCPMADMVTAEDIARLRGEYPNAAFMCYVNSSAEVKAACDICCTSTNAVAVAQSLKEKTDRLRARPEPGALYLALRTAETGDSFQRFLPPFIIPWRRRTSNRPAPSIRARPFWRIPNVLPQVLDQADFAGSTMQIINFAGKSDAKEFIIGTEPGVLHRLRKLNPGECFYPLRPSSICADMKTTTAECLRDALLRLQVPVELDARIIEKASESLKRMFAV